MSSNTEKPKLRRRNTIKKSGRMCACVCVPLTLIHMQGQNPHSTSIGRTWLKLWGHFGWSPQLQRTVWGFKTWLQVWCYSQGLVGMVRVKVGSWVMPDIYECLHKSRNMRMCVEAKNKGVEVTHVTFSEVHDLWVGWNGKSIIKGNAGKWN